MTLPFPPKSLTEVLHSFPEARRYLLAYSGGMDSHVLLHAMAVLKPSYIELIAVHINHNISEYAEEWKVHAQSTCEQLGIALIAVDVDASSPQGRSPEEWARQLRYQALEEQVKTGDVLLTAHHKDDQAETLLLQLLRGAGPRGLAAMPQQCSFGDGVHYRPLLNVSREALHKYALNHKLQWVDDNTNDDTRYDRNYLRNEVLPVLEKRWISLTDTLSRAATNQADSATLIEELAGIDMRACYEDRHQSLNVTAFKELSLLRQGNLIRYYIKELGLPVPDRKKLLHILNNVVASKYDATPRVSWNGAELRRYRNHLLALPPSLQHDNKTLINWDVVSPCEVAGGVLTASLEKGDGIKKECLNRNIRLGFRQGGETIKPAGKKHHCELKKLFQERGVPPWQRDLIPLLFVERKLVAVIGFWLDESVYIEDADAAWQLSWSGLERIRQFNQ